MRGESFDEKVKSLVREEQIPSAVRKGIDEAYERLEDQNSHKKFLGLKSIGLRPIIVFLLTIMILPTIGVIASNNVELFKDGKLVMKLTTPSTEVNKWGWQELEDYKSELKPGEAILFYEVDKYPEKDFSIITYPHEYYDLHTYQQEIEHRYVPSSELPFGYTFVKGRISLDIIEGQLTNAEHELFGKAKDSEEEILAKVVKIKESKKQMVTITHYQNEDHELFVRSSSNVELYKNLPLNDGNTTIVKVLVGSDEAFYLRDEKGEYPYQSILWIKDSVRDSVMFEVMTYSLDQVTMDELITIAEKVNE